FSWRNIEEKCIKLIDSIDKSTPLAVMLPTSTALLVKVLPPIPPPRGNLNDAVFPPAQILPILIYRDRRGVAATQSDDGDRVGFCCRAGAAVRRATETTTWDQMI